jgi:hypothetical protein
VTQYCAHNSQALTFVHFSHIYSFRIVLVSKTDAMRDLKL